MNEKSYNTSSRVCDWLHTQVWEAPKDPVSEDAEIDPIIAGVCTWLQEMGLLDDWGDDGVGSRLAEYVVDRVTLRKRIREALVARGFTEQTHYGTHYGPNAPCDEYDRPIPGTEEGVITVYALCETKGTSVVRYENSDDQAAGKHTAKEAYHDGEQFLRVLDAGSSPLIETGQEPVFRHSDSTPPKLEP